MQGCVFARDGADGGAGASACSGGSAGTDRCRRGVASSSGSGPDANPAPKPAFEDLL